MRDHLHEYNVKVKAARTKLREAINAAKDAYEAANAPLVASYDFAVDQAAAAWRRSMEEADAAYQEAEAAYQEEPPF